MQAGDSRLWDAIANKNVAEARRLLSNHPVLAMQQHPVTLQTPFTAALHAHAIDDRQDEKLAEIMQLLIQASFNKHQLEQPAGAGALKGHRRHRALMVIKLDKIMTGG